MDAGKIGLSVRKRDPSYLLHGIHVEAGASSGLDPLFEKLQPTRPASSRPAWRGSNVVSSLLKDPWHVLDFNTAVVLLILAAGHDYYCNQKSSPRKISMKQF